MLVPLDWLREYVRFEASPAELAERLSIATCEVKRILRRGVSDVDGNLDLYRVGRVLAAGKHPNADRLQLCKVDVGEPEPRQVVCGAWNFGAGATVAIALPGAVLPDGRRLEQAKLRGTVSDGMILSERELELGADHSGILVLQEPHAPGTPLADVLPLGEDVLEVELTGNRPDLLAIYGIAREVAALYGTELAPPPGRDPERSGDEFVNVQVEDLGGCPRYLARLFRGVRIEPSPAWLRARLLAAGMRPISNAVDVTNYVMLALGNPLHAFDYSKLAGSKIVVRRARVGEVLRTLDGEERRLDPADLVIADGERAVAIAGIMGSENSEVDEATTELLLEVANFEPVGILRSSERLPLRTEGSGRWEKGVDPYLAEQAARYASQLLVELTGARWTGDVDVQGDLPVRPVTRLRAERTEALTGLSISSTEQTRLLERLGFEANNGGVVTVPTWRARDVTREADVIEEVARIHGLDRVPFTLPVRREMFGRLKRDQRLRRLCEDVLVGAGFAEVYTPSLVRDDPDPQALRLPEPLSADHAVLRTTLLPSLLEAAQHNLDAGNEAIALFEIARVYLPGGGQLPEERYKLTGVAEGGFGRAKGIVETLYAALKAELRVERAKAMFLHPGKSAQTEAGWFGELHPGRLEGSWAAFELDLERLYAGAADVSVYREVSQYPPVRQDIAVVVEAAVPAADLFAAAREAAGEELRDIKFLSDYREPPIPEGRKSIAFRVEFQSPERTLTDEDAAGHRSRILAVLAERFSADLRG